MILNEGGNIFQGTSNFDQKIIPAIQKQIDSVMGKTGVKALPIGSGATPQAGKMSGDLDMIADAGAMAKYFGVADAKNARIELEKVFQAAGFETRKTGQIVHVKTNIGGAGQQVDIMVVPGGDKAQKFHVHDIPGGWHVVSIVFRPAQQQQGDVPEASQANFQVLGLQEWPDRVDIGHVSLAEVAVGVG